MFPTDPQMLPIAEDLVHLKDFRNIWNKLWRMADYEDCKFENQILLNLIHVTQNNDQTDLG